MSMNASHGLRRFGSVPLLLLVLLGLALAAPLTAAHAGELRVADDGRSVIEPDGRYRWARCVEGMQWDGKTCLGTPRLLTRDEAIALARVRNAEAAAQAAQVASGAPTVSGAWRLPRVPELRRLAHLAAQPAAHPRPGEPASVLDPQLFPAAPSGPHWSVSTQVDSMPVNPYSYANIAQGRRPDNAQSIAFLHGWVVDLDSGEAQGEVPKRRRLPVRLVHSPS